MIRKLLIGASFALCASLGIHAQAADLTYDGVVDASTGAFDALLPVGTLAAGTVAVDDAALSAGAIGVADINSIEVTVGGFCFATGVLDCGGVGALVPIQSIDSAAITGSTDTLGGSFAVTAFSPTFMVAIPITFDLDAGTFFGDGAALGTVSGSGTLTGPPGPVDLVYAGVVDSATGGFVALTPVGTPVGGPIVVDGGALAAGAIGVADILSIEVNVGGFCFATAGLTCGGVGTVVDITSIDSAAITGSAGTLGGIFAVTAFSPTFMISIPIVFDLDAGTFSADGGAIGTVGGTGALSVATDADGDGVFDVLDNCTMVANPMQIDSNGDGFGNRCDTDFNNDCVVNFVDIAAFSGQFLGSDPDFDINGDGAVNFVDFVQVSSTFLSQPGPSGLAMCP